VRNFVESEINPHVDEWEAAEHFPSHEIFKKLGDLGLLGHFNKPQAYGGMGLDYSYSMVDEPKSSALINCGGVPMAIGVQTDMCTPALARFGSDELRASSSRPSHQGRVRRLHRRLRSPAPDRTWPTSRPRAKKDGGDYVINGSKMWITNGTQADWMCLLANTQRGRPAQRNKSLICVPMKTKGGMRSAKKLDKLGMRSSDTAQIYFDDVRVPQRYRIGEEGHGLHLPDAAVPGGAAVGDCLDQGCAGWQRDRPDHRLHARAPGLRQAAARQPGGALQAGRTADRGRAALRALIY
jgi:citronellyl-CoA dehydrogenase